MKVYKWILCILLVVGIAGSFIYFGILRSDDSVLRDSAATAAPSEAQQDTADTTVFDFSEEAFNTRLITAINTYRQQFSLPAWTEDPELTKAAEKRAYECSILESKGHTRTDGSAWYTVLNITENYNYSEITGICGQSPDGLLRSWFDSDTIKNGLLSPDFSAYGVACSAVGSDVYCVLILFKA